MTRGEQIQSILLDALEVPEPAREEFVRAASNGDDAIAERVLSLIRTAENTDGQDLFATGQIESDQHAFKAAYLPEANGADLLSQPSDLAGQSIAHFTLIRELGRGGMGVVYEALQERPSRRVALKVLLAGFGSMRWVRRRLELEAEVLARLRHPGIAQVYEAGVAGTAARPQPYFAMELIDGLPLNDFASQQDLTVRERLGLIAKVADAVEHAHQRGVIHRDLKPANILITEDGQPKILDFGIARITDADIKTTTMHTSAGAILGTIAYMSPEQASGDPAAVDTRSDVYSLGVLGFELLSGRLPHAVDDTPIHEAVRMIREDAPTTLATLDTTLRGDIDTMIAKAVEADPDRRYASAASLADDIRRYLADLPIAARRPSTLYQLRKFSRRNKALVSGLASTIAVLLVGLLVVLVFASRERDQRIRADANALEARRNAAELIAGTMLSVTDALEERGDPWEALDQHGRVPEDERGWPWRLIGQSLPSPLQGFETPVLPDSTVPAWVFLDDEHLAAFDSETSAVLVRSTQDATSERRLFGRESLSGLGRIAPSGRAVGWTEGGIRVVNLHLGTVEAVIDFDPSHGAGGVPVDATVSNDGRLVTLQTQHESHVWFDGEPIGTYALPESLDPNQLHARAAPGGGSVFFSEVTSVIIRDAAGNLVERHRPRAPLDRIAAFPVAGGWVSHEWLDADESQTRVQHHTGTECLPPSEVRTNTNRSTRVEVSADGARALVGGRGGVTLYALADGVPVAPVPEVRSDGFVACPDVYSTRGQLSPSGNHLLILMHDRAPWLIDLDPDRHGPDGDPRSETYTGHSNVVYHLGVSNDGSLLATLAPGEHEVRVWDSRTLETVAVLPRRALDWVSQDAITAFTPERDALFYTSPMLEARDEVALVRADLRTGEQDLFWPETPVTSANHAPLLDLFIRHADPVPGQRLNLKIQMLEDTAIILDRDYRDGFDWVGPPSQASGERWRALPQPGLPERHDTLALSLHPDGSRVATVSSIIVTTGGARPSESLLSIRTPDGTLLRTMTLPRLARCLAYSPDGSLIAIGVDPGRVLILETEFYTTRLDMKAHDLYIRAVAWLDEHRLVTVSGDSTVKIWDDRGWSD
ncbi:MAG: WD40 repeat domain-containing serine/threonine protein kinase [Phycisphaerales bacterium]